LCRCRKERIIKREIFPTAGISKIEEIGEESEVPRFNI